MFSYDKFKSISFWDLMNSRSHSIIYFTINIVFRGFAETQSLAPEQATVASKVKEEKEREGRGKDIKRRRTDTYSTKANAGVTCNCDGGLSWTTRSKSVAVGVIVARG